MFKTMLFVFVYGASPVIVEKQLHREVPDFGQCQTVYLPAVRNELNRQGKNYLAFCRDVPR
jgi:hypothetical protein